MSGRLIERAESEGAAAAPPAAAPLPGSAAALGGLGTGPRFGSLIRRLTIRLDPEQYPTDGVITWSKALHEGPAKEKFSIRSAARSPMQKRAITARLGKGAACQGNPEGKQLDCGTRLVAQSRKMNSSTDLLVILRIMLHHAMLQKIWPTATIALCRRLGKQEVKVTVEVEPEGEKEQHELAKPLANLLGIKHESRANTLQALFTYIRLHKLQVCLRALPPGKFVNSG